MTGGATESGARSPEGSPSGDHPPSAPRASRRFIVLLAALLAMLALSPVLSLLRLPISRRAESGVGGLVFSLLMVSAVFALSERRRTRVVLTVLAFVGIVSQFAPVLAENRLLRSNSNLTGAAFLVCVIVLIVRHILRRTEVDIDTVCASLCVYLLMGLVWAYLYAELERLLPGSFALGGAPVGEGRMTLGDSRTVLPVYFSFVTLSTLGYGDVTPVSVPARMMAVSEAVIGQLYLVTLVARLVGMEIAQRLSGPPGTGRT